MDRLPPDLAEEVVEKVRASTGDLDDVEIRVDEHADRVAALVQEQQADFDDVVQGPPISTVPISGAQVRGAVVGALGFGAVGLVVGVLIGLIPMFDLALAPRVGLWALVCTMGASASGFVFGGGREPELEGALRDTSADVTVAVVSDAPEARARALRIMGDADLEVSRRAKALAKEDHPQRPVDEAPPLEP